jgi:hypothetical protein
MPATGLYRFRLFLSHVSDQKDFVAEVQQCLGAFAIEAFVAHKDIEPTREWILALEKALDECHALAAFLSPSFRQSKWTDQEIGYCLGRRTLIIPVHLGLAPYGFMERFQAVEGGDRSPSGLASRLFGVLVAHQKSAQRMAEALVAEFEDTEAPAEIKQRIAMLEQVKEWTPALLQRLEKSLRRNEAIQTAEGIAPRVRAILRKHQ